jgi:hypothetical protein
MKNKKIYAILILLISFQFNSCDDFLDKQPLDQYGETAVWGDPALMETFVNNIYYQIPHGFLGKIGMMMICDEGMRVSDRGAGDVTRSLVTPSNYSIFDTQPLQQGMRWSDIYKQIRACNLFLEQTEKNTYGDIPLKNRLTGEVHFLRAYYYHMMAFMYGGHPIITKSYGLTDDPMVERNSFAECITFISEECDKAANLLPLRHETVHLGRATKGAALALKARVLLYAASELFHNNSWAGNYAHPELIGYTGGERASYWRAAKDAAKAVIDLNVYDIYKKDPGLNEDLAKNYGDMFILKETEEDIFIRFFTQISMESTERYHPGLHNSSNGYHGHGSNNPIGQLVDDFEMSNGDKFDWSNPIHKANPYENRDPRLYASILYDGAQWRIRPIDVQPLDPIGIIQTGFYEQPDGTWAGGLDTRSSPIEDWNGTGSGYYRKKAIDPAYDGQYQVQESPWRFLRYSEIILSYAEACRELGEDDEARTYLNMIRKRAGLPPVTSSGEQLRQDIRHERRIELVFEDQRYFDIRRWMIAPQVIVDAEGIDIRYHAGESEPVYSVINIQQREWKDRSYLTPIKLDEINRNNLLIQNPLY